MKKSVEINCDKGIISGELTLPPDSRGIVLFAHGSGIGRSNTWSAGPMAGGFATSEGAELGAAGKDCGVASR